MDYRERCYSEFVSKHWNYIHVLSREEFDFHAELYSKTYLPHLPADHGAPILDVACGPGIFCTF